MTGEICTPTLHTLIRYRSTWSDRIWHDSPSLGGQASAGSPHDVLGLSGYAIFEYLIQFLVDDGSPTPCLSKHIRVAPSSAAVICRVQMHSERVSE